MTCEYGALPAHDPNDPARQLPKPQRAENHTPSDKAARCHAASVQDVIDALNEGREPFITGEEAMKAVRVVEACLRSGGSPVTPGGEK